MSDGALLNEIIQILEKSQNVKIWDSQNELKSETILKLRELVREHVNSEINKHVIKKFGVPNE
jgi:hypothetical protein